MGHRWQRLSGGTAGVQTGRLRQEHLCSCAASILGHDSSLTFLSMAGSAPPGVLAELSAAATGLLALPSTPPPLFSPLKNPLSFHPPI